MKKLLANKGYTLLHEGEAGTDLYLALEPTTGNVCLVTACEGTQFFKEIILTDEQVDCMFQAVYKDYVKEDKGLVVPITNFAKSLINKEGFEVVTSFERNLHNSMKRTNEALVRNIKEEQVITLAQVSYINDYLVNTSLINLSYEDVAIICDYLVKLTEKAVKETAKVKEEQTENKEEK